MGHRGQRCQARAVPTQGLPCPEEEAGPLWVLCSSGAALAPWSGSAYQPAAPRGLSRTPPASADSPTWLSGFPGLTLFPRLSGGLSPSLLPPLPSCLRLCPPCLSLSLLHG